MKADELMGELRSLERVYDVSLTSVERLLLSTDGTVTRLLCALSRTDVTVDILKRTVDEDVLDRQVVIVDDQLDRTLVWAQSEMFLDELPPSIRRQLVDGDIGIGDLLGEENVETRRELVSLDLVEETELPAFVDDSADAYLKRAYRIITDDAIAMRIAEFYPRGRYERY